MMLIYVDKHKNGAADIFSPKDALPILGQEQKRGGGIFIRFNTETLKTNVESKWHPLPCALIVNFPFLSFQQLLYFV